MIIWGYSTIYANTFIGIYAKYMYWRKIGHLKNNARHFEKEELVNFILFILFKFEILTCQTMEVTLCLENCGNADGYWLDSNSWRFRSVQNKSRKGSPLYAFLSVQRGENVNRIHPMIFCSTMPDHISLLLPFSSVLKVFE